MDLSPEYAQMCSQAKEIQEQWKPQDGDFFVIPKGIKREDEDGFQDVTTDQYVKTINLQNGRHYSYNWVRDIDPLWTKKTLESGTVFSEQPHGSFYDIKDIIWLPRQDQLQAMVFNKTALSLACCFKDYIVRPMFDERMPNRKEQMVFIMKASMEQMWLCFVMHTLYKLRWNGSDWVAE